MAPASSLVAAFVVLAPLFADGRALRQERGDPRTLLVIGAHMFGKDENDADYQKWKSQTWGRTILVEANPFVYRDLAAAATTFPASFGNVEVYRLLRPVEGVAAAARPGRQRGSRRRCGRDLRRPRDAHGRTAQVQLGRRIQSHPSAPRLPVVLFHQPHVPAAAPKLLRRLRGISTRKARRRRVPPPRAAVTEWQINLAGSSKTTPNSRTRRIRSEAFAWRTLYRICINTRTSRTLSRRRRFNVASCQTCSRNFAPTCSNWTPKVWTVLS